MRGTSKSRGSLVPIGRPRRARAHARTPHPQTIPGRKEDFHRLGNSRPGNGFLGPCRRSLLGARALVSFQGEGKALGGGRGDTQKKQTQLRPRESVRKGDAPPIQRASERAERASLLLLVVPPSSRLVRRWPLGAPFLPLSRRFLSLVTPALEAHGDGSGGGVPGRPTPASESRAWTAHARASIVGRRYRVRCRYRPAGRQAGRQALSRPSRLPLSRDGPVASSHASPPTSSSASPSRHASSAARSAPNAAAFASLSSVSATAYVLPSRTSPNNGASPDVSVKRTSRIRPLPN